MDRAKRCGERGVNVRTVLAAACLAAAAGGTGCGSDSGTPSVREHENELPLELTVLDFP